MVSRFGNNYFVTVVKLNDRYTNCTRLKFDFALFIYHSLNFYQFLKKVIFSLMSMVGDVDQKLSKKSF